MKLRLLGGTSFEKTFASPEAFNTFALGNRLVDYDIWAVVAAMTKAGHPLPQEYAENAMVYNLYLNHSHDVPFGMSGDAMEEAYGSGEYELRT